MRASTIVRGCVPGGVLMPALVRNGYPERFSMGLIAGTGSVGLLFPPALLLFRKSDQALLLLHKRQLPTPSSRRSIHSWMGMEELVEP